MDLGVENAGGDIRICVEVNPDCVATLSANSRLLPSAKILPQPIERLSVEEILSAGSLRREDVALLIGGPPCQPFSKSGYWLMDRRKGIDDARASLVKQFLRVLRELRPEGFIFENVAGLAHPRHRELLDKVLASASRYGYSVDWRLLHAVEYGVPQTRSRVFVIGLKGRHAPRFPCPTHWWHSKQNGTRPRLREPETAGRWIARLGGEDLFEREEIAQGRWAEHLREIPPGWNYKYHTGWAGHRAPTFVAETKYWTFLLKLSPSRPSWTIQSSAGPWTGPFHWDGRRLRVPELAALQTFPATYRFKGSRRARIRQIGNAVPCLLASKVATELLVELLGRRPRRGRRLRYRLSADYPFDPATLRHNGTRW